jgi:heat shock protein HslJ
MPDSLHFASNVSVHKKQEENRGHVVAMTDSNTLQNSLNFFLDTLLHGTYGCNKLWGGHIF